jgi:hypothetical protein
MIISNEHDRENLRGLRALSDIDRRMLLAYMAGRYPEIVAESLADYEDLADRTATSPPDLRVVATPPKAVQMAEFAEIIRGAHPAPPLPVPVTAPQPAVDAQDGVVWKGDPNAPAPKAALTSDESEALQSGYLPPSAVPKVSESTRRYHGVEPGHDFHADPQNTKAEDAEELVNLR